MQPFEVGLPNGFLGVILRWYDTAIGVAGAAASPGAKGTES
jgi:hypothetical protein